MIERNIEIEFEAEKISIEAVICFSKDGDEYEFQEKYTQIKRVVNLELNEGERWVRTTRVHFKMLEKYWEDNDVYFEI